MNGVEPAVMSREADALSRDLPTLIAVAEPAVRNALASTVEKVYLVGAGDSYNASCAAELAFESLGAVDCEPLSVQRFVDYAVDWMPEPAGTLVVVTSASGSTPRALQAVRAARKRGALTVGVTSMPDSELTALADRSVVVPLDGKERSPGIRTYQASLVALLLAAIRLGELRSVDGDPLRIEMAALAASIQATSRRAASASAQLAAEIAGRPMVFLGTGPGYGTALHAAAKLVEGSGSPAHAQDLEEWWHLERFAAPADAPTFVIAPPGRSRARASAVAATAHRCGRRVIVVGDSDIPPGDWTRLLVHGEPREELSPLLYHVFAGHLGAYVAEGLRQRPFQTVAPGNSDGRPS